MLRPYQRDHVIYDEAAARERYGFAAGAHDRLQGPARRHAPTTSPASPASATARPRSSSPPTAASRASTSTSTRSSPTSCAASLTRVRGPGAPRQGDGDDRPRRAGHHPRHGRGASSAATTASASSTSCATSSSAPSSRACPPVDEDYRRPGSLTARRRAAESETSYTLVNTEADLDALVARMREAGRFAFDLEVVGSSPYHCLLVGIAVAVAPGEAYYIPSATSPALGGAAAARSRDLVLDEAGAALRRRGDREGRAQRQVRPRLPRQTAASRARLRLRHAARRLPPRRWRPQRQRRRPAPARSA